MLVGKAVVIGKVGRPHGVKGWVKIHSFTQPTENILHYLPWFIQKNPNSPVSRVLIVDHKLHSGSILVKIQGCDTPEQAQRYVNQMICVAHDQLPVLSEDECYWADLEGLTVINAQGVTLGTVQYLMNTGANDIMVVRGDRERLIPYIQSVIQQVNLPDRTILVDWDADF